MMRALSVTNKILFRKNIDIIILFIITIISSLIISHHITHILVDHGREFLVPQEILKGKVPYKDITLVYFPLAYYINAFIYKLLGVSIDSLITS